MCVFSLRHSCINTFAMHKLPVNSSSHPLRQRNRGLCCCYLILLGDCHCTLLCSCPKPFAMEYVCGSTEPALVLVLTLVAGSRFVCFVVGVWYVYVLCFLSKSYHINSGEHTIVPFLFFSFSQNKFSYLFSTSIFIGVYDFWIL